MQRRIGTKWQLVGFGWLVAGLLAFYTLGALWEYADSLDSTNGWMLKVGFVACEASVFVWVWWHVWRNWTVTRVWCLIAATGMGIFLVVHASAVTKYLSAKKEAGVQTEKLASGLAQITGAASQGAVTGAGEVAQKLRQNKAPNSARAAIRDGANAAAEVGTANGKTLADAHLKLEEGAKNSTFLSPEYLNGKMFAVVFIALLVGVLITFLVFEIGKAEEDDDGDGIPNYADADSRYYNAARAKKWWGDRGQLAPHELNPPQPQTPPAPVKHPITVVPTSLQQPATAKQGSTSFTSGGGNFIPPPQ